MARRRGPNSRKKADHRMTLRRAALRFVVMTTGAVAVAVVVGTVAYDRLGHSYAALVGRLNALRNPTIERVEIRGSLELLPDELLRRSGVTLPASLQDIRKRFGDGMATLHPWIEKIQVVRSRGDAVTVVVNERTPVALIHCGDIRLVDAHGYILPLKRGVSYDLPLVSGLRDSVEASGVRRLCDRDRARLVALFDDMNRCDTALVDALTQAQFRGDGRVWLSFQQSPPVVVVREHAVALGLERLGRILAVAAAESGPFRVIDCSYGNIAFVTPGTNLPVATARGGVEGKSKG